MASRGDDVAPGRYACGMNSSDAHVLGFCGMGDPVSSLMHLVGSLVFAALSGFLLRRGGKRVGHVVPLAVFAVSCIILLGLSGSYHLLEPATSARRLLQRLDHAAIFLLIAGTFTPVHCILFRGVLRWGVLAVIWSSAVAGMVLKTVFFENVAEGLSLSLYLAMGWSGLLSGAILWRRFGWAFVRPLTCGALAYTGGALLEFFRQPVLIPGVIGSHEVFHGAVVAGIAYHWRFIHQLAGGWETIRP